MGGGGGGGGSSKKVTFTTPNFGDVSVSGKLRKQLAIADYQGAANQQAVDAQTAANRVNQYSPWGSVVWKQDPATNDWSQTTTLSPESQAALNSQQRIQSGLSGTAEGMINGIGDTYSKPMDYSGFLSAINPQAGPGMGDFQKYGAGPQFQQLGTLDPAALASMGGNIQAGSAGAGSTQVERAKEYDLLKKLDMSQMPDMPVANEQVRQQVSDALYNQFASRLNPQWQQRETSNLDRLYAMGAREGDPLFAQETANLGRERNDAYNQANWQSIVGGGQEMERLFNMGLGARQQGWQEALGQGQFTNEALMNQFNQGAFNAGQANTVGMANAANATQASIANAGNATQAAIAGANNRTNLFGMGLNYNLGATGMNNQYAQQGYMNDRGVADQWNTLAQQAYGNQRQFQQDTAAERSRQIAEALQQRNQPLNELNALLYGQQVGNPQFTGGPSTTAGGAEAGNYYGAYTDFLARQAAERQSMMNAVSGGVGAAAGMFSFSDRRLKSNVVRIGSTISGIPVYEYDIFGSREVGVMADEVPESWTAVHPSGYMMVDYARVW